MLEFRVAAIATAFYPEREAQRERERERERERKRDLAIVCAVRKRDGLSKRRNRWTRTGKVDWKGTRNSRRKRENAD